MIFFQAHEIVESRHNVKLLWDEVGLNRIKFMLCADHKMNNIVFGIQPHSSKFPCYICTAQNPRKPGIDWEKGDLRTLGMICGQCTDWRNSGASLKCAKNYHSCVAMPLFDDNDDTHALSLCPISELHILLRVFNHMFKEFSDAWATETDQKLGSTSVINPAEKWAMS